MQCKKCASKNLFIEKQYFREDGIEYKYTCMDCRHIFCAIPKFVFDKHKEKHFKSKYSEIIDGIR
jgi:DNA-directed RNA polymerase subunit RPC12/RpoP